MATDLLGVMGRRAVWLFLLLAIASSVAADALFARQISITVWHPWGYGELQSAYNDMIADFEGQHPDIKIQSAYVVTTEIDQKLQVALAGGVPPNVTWGFPALMQRITGSLLPLDGYLRGPMGFDTRDIYDGFWDAARVDGVIYGVPIEANVVSLVYNRDLLGAVGLGNPTDEWTWSDLRQYARRLKKDLDGDGTTDIYGMWVPVKNPDDPWPWMPWARANGGDVLSEDGRRSTISSSPVQEALSFLFGLVHEDGSMPLNGPPMGFAAGGLGISQSGPWELSGFESARVDFDSVLFPVPPGAGMTGKKPHNTMLLIAHLFGMRASEELDDATFTFLKWFTERDNNVKWSLRTGYTPIRQSAFRTPAYQEYLRGRKGLGAFIRGLTYGEARPFWLPYWSQAKDVVQEAVISIFDRKVSLMAGLESADRRINAIIAGSR